MPSKQKVAGQKQLVLKKDSVILEDLAVMLQPVYIHVALLTAHVNDVKWNCGNTLLVLVIMYSCYDWSVSVNKHRNIN